MSAAAMTLPAALQPLAATSRWIVWRSEIVNGRLTKVPYQRPGRKASTTDPATWCSFDQLPLSDGKFNGPGIVLHGGFQGVDLDACIDGTGTLEPWAAEIVERLDSYCEVSPSQRGLKVFFYGPEGASAEVGFGDQVEIAPGVMKRREVAYFTQGRYFTTTGDVWRDVPLRTITQADADWLRSTIEARRTASKKPKSAKPEGASARSRPRSVDELIRDGAPDGDRSDQFHRCVCARLDQGRTEDQIESELAAHPAGIAEKYIGRVRAEIERCKAKWRAAWPNPQPIPDALLPVPAFDIGLLPEPLASWVADVAERTQCPAEYPALGMLVAIGSALGRRVAVRPNRQDDWHEFANLWGVIVGAPGVLKSPAISEALKPLRRLEAVEHERHELAMKEWRAEAEAVKVRREANRYNANKLARTFKEFDKVGLVLDDSAEEPHAKRYIVNDTSPEALGVILSHNPQGVLAHRDELAGLLASMEREGNEGARQFYLSAYSGKEPYQFDRITRGETRIASCCVAMLGTIQPAILARHIRDAAETGGGDGLLSRFSMLVWPDMPGTWRDVDRWPDTPARQAVNALFDRIAGLDPSSIGAQVNEGAEGEVPAVRFSAEARALFVEWRAELEQRLRAPTGEDSLAFQAHLAKYRKLVPALALIFHAVEGGAHDIGLASVERALAWADLLEAHARRAYGAAGRAHAEGARALLAKLRAGAVGGSGGFSRRDGYLKGWSMIDTRERAAKAADLLADLDYLRAEVVETGGRPSTVYTVSPRVRS